MAGNPACQYDDGQVAVFIGTNLNTGDTVTLCAEDLVTFCATLIEGMTGVPVPALLEADAELARSIVDEPLTDDEAAPEVEADEVNIADLIDAGDDVTDTDDDN